MPAASRNTTCAAIRVYAGILVQLAVIASSADCAFYMACGASQAAFPRTRPCHAIFSMCESERTSAPTDQHMALNSASTRQAIVMSPALWLLQAKGGRHCGNLAAWRTHPAKPAFLIGTALPLVPPQVMEILTHVNNRIRDQKHIKLPLVELAALYLRC